jgi:hypothetical protein
MHLAYCSDTEAFSRDQLRDKAWSYRFPGSGWLTCLYQLADEAGMDVVSGDVALAHVAAHKWNAQDVHVIQEMTSAVASKLLDAGAIPFLITCLEAPLYAPFFYDQVERVADNFRYSLGFGFAQGEYGTASRINLPFRFPSFYLTDMRELRTWEDRKKVVLVAANKYRSKRIYRPGRLSLMSMLRQAKSAGWQCISPAYRLALVASLHDQRLAAIEHFAAHHDLALYGSGWDDLKALPASWGDRLQGVLNDQYQGICQNKLETISLYRYAVSYENMILPGYVTEKIIDCFVAGTVPLYLGAPDVDTLIPAQSFIDMRNFESFTQLDAAMAAMQERDAITMITAGRDYLRTEIGMLHSYEGFASNVVRLATT